MLCCQKEQNSSLPIFWGHLVKVKMHWIYLDDVQWIVTTIQYKHYSHFCIQSCNLEFWSNKCCLCCVKYIQHASKCYIYTWCFKLMACPTLFPSRKFNPRGHLCPISNKETHIYDKSDRKWRQHKKRKNIKESMCLRCIIILSGSSRGFGKQLFFIFHYTKNKYTSS